MRVKVKFKIPMMKNGRLRNPGEELEIDSTQALLLAKRGSVEIPGYSITQETRVIDVDILVPTEAK